MNTEQASVVAPNTPPRCRRRVAPWVILAISTLTIASPAYASGGETTRPEYGLLIVSFLFLMGVSQVGVVFCAIHRLAYAHWAKPYYRLAELGTMAFAPFAIVGFLLIYHFARADLFYWLSASPETHLSPWLNSDWLLIRNLLGLLAFYGLSAIYVWKSLAPDLDGAGDVDHRRVERQLYFLSPLVLVAFVVCNTFFAWDFAMMIIPHWHSTVFPIHFWFGNVYAGTAALLAIPVILGRFSVSESHFGPVQIRNLSKVISGFMLLWLYLFWAQFFVIWFGNLPHESDPVWRQLYGHFAPYYWTMMAGCFFVPFVALIFAIVNRSLLAMCILALGINLGIWINKYLMVIPVYSPNDRPVDNLLDLGLSLGLLVGFLVVVVLLARRFPVYANWEMNLEPETVIPYDSNSDPSG